MVENAYIRAVENGASKSVDEYIQSLNNLKIYSESKNKFND